MFYKAKSDNASFAFALGGAAMVGAFVPVPVAVTDHINEAWDERLAGAKPADSVRSNGVRFTGLAAGCC